MHAYNELYLDDARNSLGEALDCSVYCCSVSVEQFFERFLATPWAVRFETGVPGAVAGKSGTELAMAVIRETGGLPDGGTFPPPQDTVKPSVGCWLMRSGVTDCVFGTSCRSFPRTRSLPCTIRIMRQAKTSSLTMSLRRCGHVPRFPAWRSFASCQDSHRRSSPPVRE